MRAHNSRLFLDHLANGHSGWDHRQNLRLVRYLDIQDKRAVVVNHLFQCAPQIGFDGNRRAAAAIAFGNLNEVRVAFRNKPTGAFACWLQDDGWDPDKYEHDCRP